MLHVIMNFNNLGADTLVFHIFCNNRPQTLNTSCVKASMTCSFSLYCRNTRSTYSAESYNIMKNFRVFPPKVSKKWK